MPEATEAIEQHHGKHGKFKHLPEPLKHYQKEIHALAKKPKMGELHKIEPMEPLSPHGLHKAPVTDLDEIERELRELKQFTEGDSYTPPELDFESDWARGGGIPAHWAEPPQP